MKMLRVALIGMALWIGCGVLLEAQSAPPFPARQQQPTRPGGEMTPIGSGEPVSPQMQEQQARSRNNDRQKHLVDDTNKLLTLATELKQDVDKTNKDMMSVEVIRKADEIEKLAHSVKERMKQ